MENENRPILQYATGSVEDVSDRYLRLLHLSRLIAIASFALSLFLTAMVAWNSALVGSGIFLAAVASTLFHMTRFAAREFGARYAAGHLALAIVLLLVLFIGLIVIPSLVVSDLHRRRIDQER